MFNYHEFEEAVVKAVSSLIEADVKVVSYVKDNTPDARGITLEKKGDSPRITPVIPLNMGLYDAYLDGEKTIDEIADYLASNLKRDPALRISLDDIVTWDKVKDFIFPRITNRRFNAARLKEAVWIPVMGDLAMTFHYILPDISRVDGTTSILIRKDLFERYGITKEELYQTAIENDRRKHPADITSLGGFIAMNAAMCGFEPVEMPADQPELLIVSNEEKLNGAVCVMQDGVLSRISDGYFGGANLMILPSSVHEVLVTIDNGKNSEFSSMVQEINETRVANDEWLSDHIYLYNRETDTITIPDEDKESLTA